MSAVEAAIEKIKGLDENQALELLRWMELRPAPVAQFRKPSGAQAMIGFARRFRAEARPTESWMRELRAGEK